MGVGAVLAGAGDVVALDDVIERQAQDVFVEAAGLLRVPRAVGVLVQLLERGRRRQAGQRGCGRGGGGGSQDSGHGRLHDLLMRNAFTIT